MAIIGAGGIGFDVAEFLAHDPSHAATSQSTEAYMAEWGVDMTGEVPGGLVKPEVPPAFRSITLCQRKDGKLGAGLGKTTGWIHRSSLKKRGVEMLGSVRYERVDDAGLHITVQGEPRVLAVDNVIVCAGQVSARELAGPLQEGGARVHLIGGADEAGELDAKRAIDQGTRLACEL